MQRPRIPSKKRRRHHGAAGLPREAKSQPTPRSSRGWEIQLGRLGWMPAWKGHRPRVGGSHITRYRNFGRIRAVRPTELD